MTAMARSAHGLTSASDDGDWRPRGACAGGDWPADWWTNRDTDERYRRWAAWVCRNECPVQSACRQWAQDNPELVDQAVYGGHWWTRAQTETGRRHGPVRPSQRYPPLQPPEAARTLVGGRPLPCGTRAAAHRHRAQGEPPCGPCAEAEREYDRERAAKLRGAA